MTMKAMVGAALALLVAQAASAQEARVTIEGTSTVRSWSCEAPSYTLTPVPARGFEAGVLSGEKALESLRVSFSVDAIECGNATMNEHLRKALKADAHPQITYTLGSYETQEGSVRAEGRLSIAGTERPLALDVAMQPTDGGLRVSGEQQIRMTEFGVQPPRLMLGTLKVGDVVTVKFDVPLRPQPSAVAAASQ